MTHNEIYPGHTYEGGTLNDRRRVHDEEALGPASNKWTRIWWTCVRTGETNCTAKGSFAAWAKREVTS